VEVHLACREWLGSIPKVVTNGDLELTEGLT
jgi:hypothetical protein